MEASPLVSAPVAVVVVNYGSHRLLETNLTLGDDPRWRVLVVDNETTAAERSAVSAQATRRGWQLLAGTGNPGFGAAVNLAARRARDLGCGSLLLLNPDAVVTAEVVVALAERVTQQPLLVTCPRIVDSAGGVYFSGSWLNLGDGRIRGRAPAGGDWVPWLTGACLAISLPLFERIGGFDADYFLYWEDVDLSYRALRAGARLQVSEDLVAVHDEGGTQQASPSRAKSPVYYRYNTRNRLLFARRHLTGRARWRWLLLTPRVSWEILLRGGRRQLVESPRPLWAAVRGSLAGIGLALLPGARPRGRQDRQAHGERG